MTAQRGDLMFVRSPGEDWATSLAVVLDVNTDHKFAEIALVHPYPELATSSDGIVRRGTHYDVVVETDLRGVVWLDQLHAEAGSLEPEALDIISDLVFNTSPEEINGVRIGFPLAGPSDGRWSFKKAEGQMLSKLTSDCTNQLLTETA